MGQKYESRGRAQKEPVPFAGDRVVLVAQMVREWKFEAQIERMGELGERAGPASPVS